jgi:hypothetical protein
LRQGCQPGAKVTRVFVVFARPAMPPVRCRFDRSFQLVGEALSVSTQRYALLVGSPRPAVRTALVQDHVDDQLAVVENHDRQGRPRNAQPGTGQVKRPHARKQHWIQRAGKTAAIRLRRGAGYPRRTRSLQGGITTQLLAGSPDQVPIANRQPDDFVRRCPTRAELWLD